MQEKKRLKVKHLDFSLDRDSTGCRVASWPERLGPLVPPFSLCLDAPMQLEEERETAGSSACVFKRKSERKASRERR